MRINVRVQPGAPANKKTEMSDGTIKVWLTARAHDNEANDALIKFLAQDYGIAKSRIRIIKGLASKNKVVEIA